MTPQPPAQDAELPTMDDAVAAGDGTLHGAIDYWQGKCAALTAERVAETERANRWFKIADEQDDRAEAAERNLAQAMRVVEAARWMLSTEDEPASAEYALRAALSAMDKGQT